MKIDRVIVGDLCTNCYILSIDNKCLIIDPGDEYKKIEEVIDGKDIIGIIITHYHFDHVGALKYFDKKLLLDISNLEEKEYNIDNFSYDGHEYVRLGPGKCIDQGIYEIIQENGVYELGDDCIDVGG